jgi:aspartate aminotransferase-like enzyme
MTSSTSSSSPHIKLFIPGPVEVSPEAYAAMSRPMIGHRSGDFSKLYAKIQPQLQKLFYTRHPVYLMTTSSFGAMEASIRNLVNKKALFLCNGAWSEKWFQTCLDCGKPAEALSWEWGTAIDPVAVEKKLAEGGFDALMMVGNETSTGQLNPIAEVMAVAKKFPEVMTVVDTVSVFSAMKIPQDEWGIDVMLTGTQKALALPPGMALVSVSDRALARAKTVPHRGFYLDFLAYQDSHEKNQTPNTPAVSLIFGLDYVCEKIEKEGLENRYARHRAANKHVVDWCEKNGFPLFPSKSTASPSLVCARNERNMDLEALNKKLKVDHHMMINTGYAKIKGKTFRISTMGDETVESVTQLTNNLDKVLSAL